MGAGSDTMSEYLVCDAKGCGHVENAGAITPLMIGKPCPDCGADLLTAADLALFSAMSSSFDSLRRALPPLAAGAAPRVLIAQASGGRIAITVAPLGPEDVS